MSVAFVFEGRATPNIAVQPFVRLPLPVRDEALASLLPRSRKLVLGEDAASARSDAERILQLETKLAQAQMSRVEMRIPENRYHMMPVSQLASMAPAVDWNAYLNALGVNQSTVNVTEPKYIEAVNRLLSDVPLDDWKTLLRWNVINAAAPA